MSEISERHIYETVLWTSDLKLYLMDIDFYEGILNSDIKKIDEDPDLKAILGEEERRQFEINHELDRVNRTKEWIQKKIDSGKNHHLCDILHWTIRFLKSIVDALFKLSSKYTKWAYL